MKGRGNIKQQNITIALAMQIKYMYYENQMFTNTSMILFIRMKLSMWKENKAKYEP